MAAWCLTARQTPDVWRALTRLERDAFINVANRKQR
mgnify:CR=1 FL=1